MSELERDVAVRSGLIRVSAPWYHYIPLKPDYSDLYDIMAFFVGPVDEEGNVDETKGHRVSSHPRLLNTMAMLVVDKRAHLVTSVAFADDVSALGSEDRGSWTTLRGRTLVMARHAGICEAFRTVSHLSCADE